MWLEQVQPQEQNEDGLPSNPTSPCILASPAPTFSIFLTSAIVGCFLVYYIHTQVLYKRDPIDSKRDDYRDIIQDSPLARLRKAVRMSLNTARADR